MTYQEKRHLFHMMAGTFLCGKSYAEYCLFLAEAIPLKGANGLPIKGNKTLKVESQECEFKASKHMDKIAAFLKREENSFKTTLEEVNNIEKLINDFLMLSPQGQIRVKNLMEKIKRDQYEIDYWKNFEEEQKQLEEIV